MEIFKTIAENIGTYEAYVCEITLLLKTKLRTMEEWYW